MLPYCLARHEKSENVIISLKKKKKLSMFLHTHILVKKIVICYLSEGEELRILTVKFCVILTTVMNKIILIF